MIASRIDKIVERYPDIRKLASGDILIYGHYSKEMINDIKRVVPEVDIVISPAAYTDDSGITLHNDNGIVKVGDDSVDALSYAVEYCKSTYESVNQDLVDDIVCMCREYPAVRITHDGHLVSIMKPDPLTMDDLRSELPHADICMTSNGIEVAVGAIVPRSKYPDVFAMDPLPESHTEPHSYEMEYIHEMEKVLTNRKTIYTSNVIDRCDIPDWLSQIKIKATRAQLSADHDALVDNLIDCANYCILLLASMKRRQE